MIIYTKINTYLICIYTYVFRCVFYKLVINLYNQLVLNWQMCSLVNQMIYSVN